MSAGAYWARLHRDTGLDVADAAAGRPPNPYSFASSAPVPRAHHCTQRQVPLDLDDLDPYDAHWLSLIGRWEDEQQRADDWAEHGASDRANRVTR